MAYNDNDPYDHRRKIHINTKMRCYSNINWISRRLVVLVVFSFLLSSCQPIARVRTPITTTPTTVQHLSVTPTQQTVRVPTASPAQKTAQPSSASPIVGSSPSVTQSTTEARIKSVFIIVMETHNWSDILNNPSAPYINQTLLPQASYAQQYNNLPGVHLSEPNYLC